jgi:hypothetical protein
VGKCHRGQHGGISLVSACGEQLPGRVPKCEWRDSCGIQRENYICDKSAAAGPADKRKNPTVVKEQTEDHQQFIRLLKVGTATEGIVGCYRIVVVKAAAIPSKQPKQANDMKGTTNASER